MSNARLRRVNKEIAGTSVVFSRSGTVLLTVCMRFLDCKNDQASHITIDLVDNSPFHLIGAFDGPEDTPYQGGRFEVVRVLSKVFCSYVLILDLTTRLIMFRHIRFRHSPIPLAGHHNPRQLPLSAGEDEVHY